MPKTVCPVAVDGAKERALHYEYFDIDFHGIGMFFMWLAVAVTLWSGIMYFRKFWYVLDREDIHIRSDE